MTQSVEVLQSERLIFSTWSEDQIDDVIKLHSDPEVTQYLTGAPEGALEAKRRLNSWASHFEEFGWCKFRVTRKSDGKFLGRAGFGPLEPENPEPEIGYALLKSEWGNGYAIEAAAALRDWMFERTKHDCFLGYAYSENAASIKILLAIGMKFTHTEVVDSGKQLSFHKLSKDELNG